MKIKPIKYSIELTQDDLNNLEAVLFNILHKPIDSFDVKTGRWEKEEIYPTLTKLWNECQKFRRMEE